VTARDEGVEELEAERLPHGAAPGAGRGAAGAPAGDARGGPAVPPQAGGTVEAATERRVRHRGRALALAIAADLVQFVLVPTLVGEMSPVNQVIDLGVMAVLIRLIGFHWALLPTFLIELVPFADVVPLWTLAVLIATRGAKKPRP
jgi:hypothetical protein